jgi:hypothetical protein
VLESYQLEGSEAEERLPAQTGNKDELGDGNLHQQQLPPSSLCATSYEPQILPELHSAEAVTCGVHSSTQPISYQQQQSEEEDFNQANLVNTVVVNNSSIATEPLSYIETKQGDLVDTVNIKVQQSTGHNSFVKNDLQSKFLSKKVKVSAQDVLIDGDVSLNEASRINVSETSAEGNVVVSDFDLKTDKADINGINIFSTEKCEITEVKSPLSCVDIPTSAVTTPKAAYGLVAESVAADHHASGQNVTTDTAGAAPGQKSWASLFKTHDAGTPANRTPSGIKPLACVKPFQNKVTVTPDTSCSALDGCSTPQAVSPAVSPGVSNAPGNSINSLPQLPSPCATDDPHLYQLGGGFPVSAISVLL